MSRYWEVTGPLRESIRDVLARRRAALKEADEYAKSLGGDRIGFAEQAFGGVLLVVIFDGEPDGKLWKPVPNSAGCYLPRKATKDGKVVGRRLGELGKAVPGAADIADLIGYDTIVGLQWRVPGCTLWEKRVFVVTDDGWSPPEKVARHVKRVSDLAYEKATKWEADRD